MGVSLAAVSMNEPDPRAIEKDLVVRAQKGEQAAFETLYRQHVGRIYGLCLRMTGQPALADDCAQEAFIRAWYKLPEFRGQSAFGTWLHRIAVNQVLGHKRSSQRQGAHLELLAGQMTGTSSPAPESAGFDVEKAIAKLPEGARDVLLLCGVGGFSHEEASSMLGIAVGTSKAQLHRARRLLKDQMDS